MIEFLMKVWMTSMVLTTPIPWIEELFKPRNNFYIGLCLLLVVVLDIGLLFVMLIMKIWGIE